MPQELFALGDGLHAINCNPGGKFHGWVFRKHPDGQYVSLRQLELIENPAGPAAALFLHVTPKPDACEHNFEGWREIDSGQGGEQVCTKCGMGAMEYTLRTGV